MDLSFIDARFFEMLFLLCFGLAWPFSIFKSIRSKTAKGKSFFFLAVAFLGYLFGITSKLIDSSLSYTLVFYLLNTTMVGTDIVLYFINTRRDKLRDAAQLADSTGLA